MKTYARIVCGLCLILVLFVATASGGGPQRHLGHGQLVVASHDDSSVLSFDAKTGEFQSVFVAPNSGGLDHPLDLTIGPDGNVYVTGWGAGSVIRYEGRTGAYLDTFVERGSGGLYYPDQVVFGPDGRLYVSDRFAGAIRRYDGQTGEPVDTFVVDSRLNGFVCFTFGPDGNIYAGMFNAFGEQRILRFSGTTGAFIDVFNSGDPHLDSAFGGLVFGPDGNLYASRFHADCIERYDGTTGAFIDRFVPVGSGGLDVADYLVFGPGNDLYVSGQGSGNVLRYDGTTGAFVEVFASHTNFRPKGLAFKCVPPLSREEARQCRPPVPPRAEP